MPTAQVSDHEAWVRRATPPEGYVFAREEGRMDAGEYVDLLRTSGLPRPIDDLARIRSMLANSNLVITARDRAGRLVGASRCVTDFSWSCYLADLCVGPGIQGLGLGTALVAETKRTVGPQSTVLLLSVPRALQWYAKIGMDSVDNGFIILRNP
jgi:ribosomal protein S18 acetylase RimI-like enzyme